LFNELKNQIKNINALASILLVAAAAILMVLTLTVFHFLLGLDLWVLKISNSDSAQYWGQIGDFVGGVLNPILSFLALIAVVLSLKSQSEETKAARIEAAAAIDIQMKNNETLSAQNKLFDQQSFDSVFFGILNMHTRNLERVSGFNVELQAREYGTAVFDRFAVAYNIDNVEFVEGDFMLSARLGDFQLRVIQNSVCFAQGEGSQVRNYFSTFEQLLRFVDEYPFADPSIKPRYIGIISSVLSPSELECIFIFALGNKDEKLLGLLISHDMLNDLPPRERLVQLQVSDSIRVRAKFYSSTPA
jgi:hypothetical protein